MIGEVFFVPFDLVLLTTVRKSPLSFSLELPLRAVFRQSFPLYFDLSSNRSFLLCFASRIKV